MLEAQKPHIWSVVGVQFDCRKVPPVRHKPDVLEQGKHRAAPELNVAALHVAEQLAAPDGDRRPAAQAVQVADAAAADEPAAHAVQPPALVVPGLVTEPA